MGTIKNGNYVANFNKNGNTKVKAWVWNTTFGDEMHTVTYNGHTVSAWGTCKGYCAGCKNACYVRKSYLIYSSVKYSHICNTNALSIDPIGTENALVSQIERAKNKPKVIRIHASGEFNTYHEIDMFVRMAKLFPHITFYTYTKAFDLWDTWLECNELPKNFVLNVSVWHEYGIDFFMKWCKLENVKAYVYCDGYDYTKAGLGINVMCPAYNRNGKLDHHWTCGEKCKLCMTCHKNSKVIGCYDH